ncbi:MerR family transcriptional regulator [bacterium]|nr:MerR family transcriptional regulator [bacterium]
MRQTKKVEGTKIAQAAKDLNVTSVTVRRYISEFNIETATDKNGIKVLPEQAMEELKEVRRLKEEGLTNPQVLESLEEQRSKPAKKSVEKVEKTEKAKKEEKPKSRAKDKAKEKESEEKEKSKKAKSTTVRRGKKVEPDVDEAEEEEEVEEVPAASRGRKRTRRKAEEEEEVEDSDVEAESEEDEVEEKSGESDSDSDSESPDGRLKHSLTCQTCGKTFEHPNPRLRDCLDCYRTKRKERRRGGDRHKNVIQHPLAQQVVSKMASQQQSRDDRDSRESSRDRERERDRDRDRDRDRSRPVREASHQVRPVAHFQSQAQPIIGGLKTKVRSYRKAIDETRNITSSLKRRLERPDLPEGERRWLEQIYAYQLILHQGWRHLSEYRSTTNQQARQDD